MIENIIAFYNHPFFIVFGGVSATLLLAGVILNIIFWFLGIAPLLRRLGFARWFRKIDIVASLPAYNTLKTDLVDSGIFRESNIQSISPDHLSKVKNSDLMLVDYRSFTEEQITEILSDKKSVAGMIFYFPNFSSKKGEFIPDDMRNKISNTPNTTLVNFRGRLLNDIITTLITTSYEKK